MSSMDSSKSLRVPFSRKIPDAKTCGPAMLDRRSNRPLKKTSSLSDMRSLASRSRSIGPPAAGAERLSSSTSESTPPTPLRAMAMSSTTGLKPLRDSVALVYSPCMSKATLAERGRPVRYIRPDVDTLPSGPSSWHI